MTVELPEEHLAGLLKGNDQPHKLSDDQRRRLRARLALANEQATPDEPRSTMAVDGVALAPSTGGEQSAVATVSPSCSVRDIAHGSKRRGETRRQRGGRPALIGLVAAVVVFTFVSLNMQDRERSQIVTAQLPTKPCPAEAQAFLDAVDVWNGVEEWGYLTDDRAPEPDLLTLAQTALRATTGADERTRAELAESLQQFAENRSGRQRASSGDELALTSPGSGERQELTETVVRVHIYITDSTSCD